MSNYSEIDPVIEAWSVRHALHIYTHFKDSEVRSTELVSPAGKRWQIWVDSPDGQGVGVHAWDFQAMRHDMKVPISQLGEALDESVRVVRQWMQTA
jgi:hypothetical protein